VGSVSAGLQALLSLAGAALAFQQMTYYEHSPGDDLGILSFLFLAAGLILLLAALLYGFAAWVESRRPRWWRATAIVSDLLPTVLIVPLLLWGAFAYAERRPTDFQPDPGAWPLVLLVALAVIWIASFGIVVLAAARR
jgi:hypothetical protein